LFRDSTLGIMRDKFRALFVKSKLLNVIKLLVAATGNDYINI